MVKKYCCPLVIRGSKYRYAPARPALRGGAATFSVKHQSYLNSDVFVLNVFCFVALYFCYVATWIRECSSFIFVPFYDVTDRSRNGCAQMCPCSWTSSSSQKNRWLPARARADCCTRRRRSPPVARARAALHIRICFAIRRPVRSSPVVARRGRARNFGCWAPQANPRFPYISSCFVARK